MTGNMPAAGAPSAPAGRRFVVAADAYFEYVGETALTARGPITGRSYRFSGPGARVAVDGRDAPALTAVPNLRRRQGL